MIDDISGVPVKYIPNFYDPSVTLDEIWDDIDLFRYVNAAGNKQPRYESWSDDYGFEYKYGSGSAEINFYSTPYSKTLLRYKRVVNYAFDFKHDCVFTNGYKDGTDHLGWHSDDSPEMDPKHSIAILSFGAPREIWFRKIGEKGLATKGILLEHSSALIMFAGMQQEWQHRIPKASASCGRRLSMTFRKLVV